MQDFGTIFVATILIVIVGLIIVTRIKNKKEGKTSCSCGCSGCAMSSVCHKKKEE